MGRGGLGASSGLGTSPARPTEVATFRGLSYGAYRDRTGDLRLANTVIGLRNRLLIDRFWRAGLGYSPWNALAEPARELRAALL
jgi:hypothetical protein